MIREAEMLPVLNTICEALQNELVPDLQSSHVKKTAGSMLEVLNRLIGQLRDGQRIADEQLAQWTKLTSDAADFLVDELDVHSQYSRGDHALDSLQQMLARESANLSLGMALREAGSCQQAWFREAIELSHAFWEATELAVQPPQVTASGSMPDLDPEVLRDKLNGYLLHRFSELTGNVVTEIQVASGGSAKLTAFVTLQPNPVLPDRLVLRLDLPGNLTATQVKNEYPIVERLYGLGLRVPRPYLLECDVAILGGAFMLMEAITDAVPAGTYFARDRARSARVINAQFGRDAAAELARLHRFTASTTIGENDPAAVRIGEVDEAYCQWQAMDKAPNSLVIDLGFAWLRAHPLPTGRPRCLTHGDYGVHNMMARNGRLAAVLDWELACEDDPAIDLAECKMLMTEDTLPWDEFVEAYLEAGGDPLACDPEAVNYYCVWMFVVKFGVMIAGARQYFMQGLRTDCLTASIAVHSMGRILQHAARALRMAIDDARDK